jgi:hypothetical protein
VPPCAQDKLSGLGYHRRCKITNQVMPTYSAFFNAFGKFYEGDPMTVAEFRAFKVKDLP